MSGTGESSTDFAGEEREFRIRLGEIRRIEQRCETGIGEVLRRLARAVLVLSKVKGLEALAAGVDIHADDVREPIYQGLIGGGMLPGDATKLLRIEIDDRGIQGLLDNTSTALEVLWASRKTPEEPPSGEMRAGESPATPPKRRTSKPSTASARSSGSRPATSTS
jgi:hypothetical protein